MALDCSVAGEACSFWSCSRRLRYYARFLGELSVALSQERFQEDFANLHPGASSAAELYQHLCTRATLCRASPANAICSHLRNVTQGPQDDYGGRGWQAGWTHQRRRPPALERHGKEVLTSLPASATPEPKSIG